MWTIEPLKGWPGEGTLEGRERGEVRVAEHLKVKEFPTIPGPE